MRTHSKGGSMNTSMLIVSLICILVFIEPPFECEYQYAHCFADLPDGTRGLQWQGVRGCPSAIGSTDFPSGARHACNTGRRDASTGGAVRGGSTDGHQHGCENVCSEGHERKRSLVCILGDYQTHGRRRSPKPSRSGG